LGFLEFPAWGISHWRRLGQLLTVGSVCLLLGACRCGFDCDRDDNGGSGGASTFSLGISASSIEGIRAALLQIDRVTLRHAGADDVVIDSFTVDDLDLVASDTLRIDLLAYRGVQQLVVIKDLVIDSGSYSEIVLDVSSGDINQSYVEEAGGAVRELNVAASQLSLPGFSIGAGKEQITTVFTLGMALQRSSSESYLLSGSGARSVDNDIDSRVFGSVDTTLFDAGDICIEKTDPLAGNLVYLFRGHNLTVSELGDVFTSGSTTPVDDDAIAPYSVTSLVRNETTGAYEYAFGYLPGDDYTLAFSCNALEDDPVDLDGIALPLPSSQIYEIALSADEVFECDLEEPLVCAQSVQ